MSIRTSTAATLSCVLVTACGGYPLDKDPPVAEITFPLESTVTDGETITVRGTVEDRTNQITVRVAGVTAQLNGEATAWTASVPLEVGVNTLVVETRDRNNEDLEAASVQVERVADATFVPASLALAPMSTNLFAIERSESTDGTSGRLVQIDTIAGAHTTVADEATGLGPQPWSVAVDMLEASALVFDFERKTLQEVDLATGNVAVVSGAGQGGGPAMFELTHLVYRDSGNEALALEASGALLRISLGSGLRTVLSNESMGLGPQPEGLALDEAGGRAFVLDGSLNAVFAVEIASGAVTLAADPNTGIGQAPNALREIAYDPVADRVLVLDHVDANNHCLDGDLGAFRFLLAIDLASGNRTVVGSNQLGTGTAVGCPRGLAIDDGGVVAYTGDASSGNLMSIELASGNRASVSGVEVSAGPILRPAADAVMTLTEGRVYVATPADTSSARLFSVDLESGQRRQIPDGGGPQIPAPSAIAVDTEAGQLYVTAQDQLFAVDEESGARSVVSGPTIGAGPSFDEWTSVVVDPMSGLALVGTTDPSAPPGLYEVDLQTGDRSEFLKMSGPQHLAFDPLAGFVYVVDRGPTADVSTLVSINLDSNLRRTIGELRTGVGMPFEARSLDYDPDGDRVLLAETAQPRLRWMALSDGEVTLLSGGQRGSGPTPRGPASFDSSQLRALVFSSDLSGIVAADAGVFEDDAQASGDRTIFSK